MRAAIAIGWGVELDGGRLAVGPGGAVPIPREMRHRAAGRMAILDVVVPGHFGLEIGRLDLPAQALLKARAAARAHRPRMRGLADLEEPVGSSSR